VADYWKPYNVLALLEVPGLGDKSVEDLVAEIGLDMSTFPNEKHLCSWVGIAPGNNESAGKKKADASPTETSRPKR
jgi:transposase